MQFRRVSREVEVIGILPFNFLISLYLLPQTAAKSIDRSSLSFSMTSAVMDGLEAVGGTNGISPTNTSLSFDVDVFRTYLTTLLPPGMSSFRALATRC